MSMECRHGGGRCVLGLLLVTFDHTCRTTLIRSSSSEMGDARRRIYLHLPGASARKQFEIKPADRVFQVQRGAQWTTLPVFVQHLSTLHLLKMHGPHDSILSQLEGVGFPSFIALYLDTERNRTVCARCEQQKKCMCKGKKQDSSLQQSTLSFGAASVPPPPAPAAFALPLLAPPAAAATVTATQMPSDAWFLAETSKLMDLGLTDPNEIAIHINALLDAPQPPTLDAPQPVRPSEHSENEAESDSEDSVEPSSDEEEADAEMIQKLPPKYPFVRNSEVVEKHPMQTKNQQDLSEEESSSSGSDSAGSECDSSDEEEGDTPSTISSAGGKIFAGSASARFVTDRLAALPTYTAQSVVGLPALTSVFPSQLELAKCRKFDLRDHALANSSYVCADWQRAFDKQLLSERADGKWVCQGLIWGGAKGALCGRTLERHSLSPAWLPVLSLQPPFQLAQPMRMICKGCNSASSLANYWGATKVISITSARAGNHLEVFITFKRTGHFVDTKLQSGWHRAAHVVRAASQELFAHFVSSMSSCRAKTKLEALITSAPGPFPASRSRTTLSSEILGQLNPIARQEVGFVSFGRLLMTPQALDYLRVSSAKGIAPGKAITMAKTVVATYLLKKDTNRARLAEFVCTTLNQTSLLSPNAPPKPFLGDGRCGEFVRVFLPSGKTARRFIVADAARTEAMAQSLLVSNAVGTQSFALDHLFQCGNRVRVNGATGTIVVGDQIGRPIFGAVQRNKSLTDLKKQFKLLCELSKLLPERPILAGKEYVPGVSAVKVGFSDAAADKKFFGKVMDGAVLIRDLMHFLQDFFEAVRKKSPWHHTIVCAASAATYRFYPEDLDALRTRLKQRGKSALTIEGILSSASKLKKYRPSLRFVLVSSEEFLGAIKVCVYVYVYVYLCVCMCVWAYASVCACEYRR
jgi:hypothetical protein